MVQEQPTKLMGSDTNLNDYPTNSIPISTYHTNTSQNPSVSLRFTSIYAPQTALNILYASSASNSGISSLTARDCEFYGSGAGVYLLNSSATIGLTNNLFQYVPLTANAGATFAAFNNLYRGDSSDTYCVTNYGGTIINRNNAFDGAIVNIAGTTGWNAFLNSATVTQSTSTHDITTSLTWATGPLGNFYQATNSLLLNAGSNTADQVGLYHYTVLTDQIAETNGAVSIGYHYVALGANLLPLDSNSDGIPDYAQDANGNGLVDNGETNWSGPPNNVVMLNPPNDSVLSAPASISLQASASSGGVPITNVIFYWGTIPIGSASSGPPGGWAGNWSLNWTNVAAGVYSLTAVAEDAAGGSAASLPVNVTVTGLSSTTYSTNNSFGNSYWTNTAGARGILINANYTNASGGIQIDSQITPLPYVNVSFGDDFASNSPTDGMLLRIDAASGTVLGEYRTAPQTTPTSPGHVAVDRYGNTWLANWNERGLLDGTGEGSLTRIGIVVGGTRGYKTNVMGTNYTFVTNSQGQYLQPPFQYSTAVDRDGDGLIKTSFGLDGNNILNWTNVSGGGSVSYAEDECIINYTRTASQFNSGLTVDANNDLWVGGYVVSFTWDCTSGKCPAEAGNESQEKISGLSGLVLTNIVFTGSGGTNGGFDNLIDWNGVLWSTGGANMYGTQSLVRFNPANNSTNTLSGTDNFFDSAIDPVTGNIWTTLWNADSVNVYSTNQSLITNVALTSQAACVAIDQLGNVWISHRDGSGNNALSHLLNNGTHLGEVTLTNSAAPDGLSIDSYGKVWTACFGTNNPIIARFDPTIGTAYTNNGVVYHLGTNDLSIPFANGSGFESYGDFTGFGLFSRVPAGVWSTVNDSGTSNRQWGTITWNASTADTNQVRVEVRAANSQTALTGNAFEFVTNSASLNNLFGENSWRSG